jgi:hypothetical protein
LSNLIQERIQRHSKAFDASSVLKNRALIELLRLEEILPGQQLDLNDAQNHEYPIFAVEAADTAKTTAEVAITTAKKPSSTIAKSKVTPPPPSTPSTSSEFTYTPTSNAPATPPKTIRNFVSSSRS